MNPNPPEVVTQGEGLLPVIQADRDAAAYVAKLLTGAAVEHILEGFEDDTGTVQAFARHRLRHTPDMAAFGASDAACYHYPGEDEQALRAAFCHGAEHAIGNTRHTPDREAMAKYAASTLADLSEAKEEIAMLRDIVVTYGDKVRMANAHRSDWQQAIDRAFDREN